VAHTYDELKSKTVAELREIAKDTVQGASQMNKDKLLPALCTALGIEGHAHHEAHGIDKAGIKAKMRELKAERGKALDAHDIERLKSIRRHIHKLNHQIRSHMD
jgi:hypothetical protein